MSPIFRAPVQRQGSMGGGIASGVRSFAGEGAMAKIIKTGDQTLADATATLVSFDSLIVDGGGFWFEGDAAKLFAPVAGFYICIVNIAFEANAVGQRQIQIRRNGPNGATIIGYSLEQGFGGNTNNRSVSGSDYFEQDEYCEVQLIQNSGGNLLSRSFSYAPALTMHRVVN